MLAALQQRLHFHQEFFRLGVMGVELQGAAIASRGPVQLAHASAGVAEKIMRLGVRGRGLHGAGKRFQGVGRPLGFQVADAKLAPGAGIRRIFHHQFLQQADGGGKIRLSHRLEGACQPVFGFNIGHSRVFHSRESKAKLENRNWKLEIGKSGEFRFSNFEFRFLSFPRPVTG